MFNYTPVKILFEIGSFKINSYGLMLALGFLAAIMLVVYQIKKRKLDDFHVYAMALIGLVSSIVGSRLLYILVNFNYYLFNPLQIFTFEHGGLIYYGGLILAIIGCVSYARLKKLDLEPLQGPSAGRTVNKK